MDSAAWNLSDRVVSAVADVLDKDPLELPPLEHTVSADALDHLFHGEDHPPGAHTVFPYCDLWVVAHSNGTVDVFEAYRATTAEKRFPADAPDPAAGKPVVVLHFENSRYVFSEDQVDTFQQIVAEAESGDEAWEDVIEYARQEPTT